MKCKTCGKPLKEDRTNRGVVTRCRNPECPTDEVNNHGFDGTSDRSSQ